MFLNSNRLQCLSFTVVAVKNPAFYYLTTENLLMNNKLIFWSVVVALGGFLFGMDVAVISGAEKKNTTALGFK